MIEHRLFDTRHDPRQWNGLRLRFHVQPEGIGTVAEGLLAVTEDGQLAGANAAALDLLELDWQRLTHTQIGAVLAEPLAQLIDWGQRASTTPHVVHTRSGRAVWVRVEAGRLMQQHRMASPATPQPVTTVEPADALSALDTGDAVFRSAIARARKLMGKPIAILLQGEGAPGRIREAHGGTLFLDEIGDMPLALQARLLRVLQERVVVPLGGGKPVPVDFCLVCATHRDLPTEMQAGRFREDLYYRLNGLTLRLPPLRERTDLTQLLESELHDLVTDRNVSVAPDLLHAMQTYRWPGNLRQLFNALRTACACSIRTMP